MIEKKLHLGELFAFYGPLLTDKQREILSLNLNEDYSLGEISEIFDISRQAVNDTVKKAEKAMENYESKLKCLYRIKEREHLINKASEIIKTHIKPDDKVAIQLIEILDAITEV